MDRGTHCLHRYLTERNTGSVVLVGWHNGKKNFCFFRGDFEDFDIANEDDNLEEFLGI